MHSVKGVLKFYTSKRNDPSFLFCSILFLTKLRSASMINLVSSLAAYFCVCFARMQDDVSQMAPLTTCILSLIDYHLAA